MGVPGKPILLLTHLKMAEIFKTSRRMVLGIVSRLAQLGTMRWLLEKECPWHEDTLSRAAQTGSLKVISWQLEADCPIPMPNVVNAGNAAEFHAFCCRMHGTTIYAIDDTINDRKGV